MKVNGMEWRRIMQGKMKAIVKHTRGFGAALQMVDIPAIDENEVLVKVKATSICGTDVHIYTWDAWAESRVTPPYVFGHEFAGEVVEVGASVTNVAIGDYVSAETHFVCGTCPQCLTGKAHVCQNTKILGVDVAGCFAEYVAVDASNIWKNSKEVPAHIASIQEPLGNAVHTVLSGDVAGCSVAIVGCGPIGLMAVQVAKAAGAAQVIAVDVNEYRLDIAAQIGATTVINSLQQDLPTLVAELTAGNGVDVVCEMSGHPVAIDQAFKMLAFGGRISILGLPTAPVSLDITNDIVFKGITVKGITGRLMYETWQQTSGLLQSGQLDLDKIVTHQLPFEDFEQGFELMMKGQCGKVVLTL